MYCDCKNLQNWQRAPQLNRQCKCTAYTYKLPDSQLKVHHVIVSSLLWVSTELVVSTVFNGWADTTCLSTYLAPTSLFGCVLMVPNHGRLIRTLWYLLSSCAPCQSIRSSPTLVTSVRILATPRFHHKMAAV